MRNDGYALILVLMILPRYFHKRNNWFMNFVAKKELFVFPWVIILNIWRGAIDRSGGKNKVDSVAAILIKKKFSFPWFQKELEKVGEIKTGFYYIA
jgi:hypothetical protein